MSTARFPSLALLAVAALGCTGFAFAQEATSDDWMTLPQPQTVAQQKAAEAEADAQAVAQSKAFPKGMPGKTRADVRAELAQAQHDGSLARTNAEAWSFDAPFEARATRLARARR